MVILVADSSRNNRVDIGEKMKTKRIILVMMIMVIMLVTTVQAATETGTLGASGLNTTSFSTGDAPAGAATHQFASLGALNFENTGNTKAIILFNNDNKFYFDPGAPPGATSPVTVRMANISCNATGVPIVQNGRIVGTGTVGYQRVYNNAVPPVEQTGGYLYVVMNEWNTSTDTGTQYMFLDYPLSSLYNVSMNGAADPAPPANTVFITSLLSTNTLTPQKGDALHQKLTDSWGTYMAEKPSGLGISGNITKQYNGQYYNSRGFVFNGATGALIASDNSSTATTFTFNTVASTIILGIKGSDGTMYNSSILFGGAAPTPTPTIPGGYIRTRFECVDGMTTGQVHGCNIQLKDVEADTWSNVTNDLDGNWYIDTLPSHTINGYGDATGYTAVSRLGLPAFSEGVYSLVMYTSGSMPTAGDGTVNLVVLVHDWDTGLALSGTELTAVFPNGSSRGATTGDAGQHVFNVPNSSVISVTAKKPGYLTATQSIVTSASGMDSLWMKLVQKP